jgi:hypothetical protein
MIANNLLFLVELGALTVVVCVGIWHIYRTRKSATSTATSNVAAPVAYDMRQDGQRVGA